MTSIASCSRSLAGAGVAALSDTQSGKRMDRFTHSLTQICGFDHARLVAFLRAKFPHDTPKQVARALGLRSHRTVENWLLRDVRPGFDHLGAMIGLWGPEFLCAAMAAPPDWASEALARAELEDLDRKAAALKDRLRDGAMTKARSATSR